MSTDRPDWRPLRAWRGSQLADLQRALQGCLRDWAQAWSIDGAEGEVHCGPACDVELDAPWCVLGTRAGAPTWIAEPADLAARIAFALFAASQTDTPVIRRVCDACVGDLQGRLAATLRLLPPEAASGHAPTSAETGPWSGAVQARLPFALRLLLAGDLAAEILGQAGAPAPSTNAASAALVAVADAMANVRLPLAAHLAGCAIDLGTLRSLQPGDVVHLGHGLEQPVQVRDGAGRALFDAFLAREGRHKAVELAAIPPERGFP